MHARVTQANFDPARLDEGHQFLRDAALPMLEGMEGLKAGYVLLSSPPTKAMSVLVFDSEEHMNASAASHAGMRDRATQVGVEFVSIEAYEVIGSTTGRT
jgi:hypothetical protein